MPPCNLPLLERVLAKCFVLLIGAVIGWLDAVAFQRLKIKLIHEEFAAGWYLVVSLFSGFALSRLLTWHDGSGPASVQMLLILALALSQAAAIETFGEFENLSTFILFGVVGPANCVPMVQRTHPLAANDNERRPTIFFANSVARRYLVHHHKF